jgi:hypothetical protein
MKERGQYFTKAVISLHPDSDPSKAGLLLTTVYNDKGPTPGSSDHTPSTTLAWLDCIEEGRKKSGHIECTARHVEMAHHAEAASPGKGFSVALPPPIDLDAEVPVTGEITYSLTFDPCTEFSFKRSSIVEPSPHSSHSNRHQYEPVECSQRRHIAGASVSANLDCHLVTCSLCRCPQRSWFDKFHSDPKCVIPQKILPCGNHLEAKPLGREEVTSRIPRPCRSHRHIKIERVKALSYVLHRERLRYKYISLRRSWHM